jgi:hypothetical protein
MKRTLAWMASFPYANPICLLPGLQELSTCEHVTLMRNTFEQLQEEERPTTPPLDVKHYTRPNGEQLSVQLVSKHPLWVCC